MTRPEIQQFFSDGAPLPNFGAATYAVPTLAWLTGPFWDFFKARLWNENLDKWQVRFECRDFARAYAATALECWATTVGSLLPDDGLAVGEIWFVPDAAKPEAGHAICPVFTENGLQFIEPQTGQPCALSPEQLASRYFLRF